MHPTAITYVSRQTDTTDMMSFGGIRRRLQTHIEHVSNGNSAFCYESNANGAYFEREIYDPKGVKGLKVVYVDSLKRVLAKGTHLN
nr:hypothetical protein HmN_000204600 [Hymenolepis microstoma]